jgi:hypothetical protein
MWRFILLLFVLADACIWKSPGDVFHAHLIHLSMDTNTFKPENRRRLKVIHVINSASVEKNAELAGQSNAIRSSSFLHNEFSGGLQQSGHTTYNIVYDKLYATKDIVYKIVDIKPHNFFKEIDLNIPSDEIIILHLDRDAHQSLEYNDKIVVVVAAYSKCLLSHEMARTFYDFNITATYDLFHKYKNTLKSKDYIEWSEDGWLGEATIIMHPSIHKTLHTTSNVHIQWPPCPSKMNITTWINVYNTSKYTFWNPETRKYDRHHTFIGGPETIHRCHQNVLGNVCVVEAGIIADQNNSCPFILKHAVSQFFRMQPTHNNRTEEPKHFNISNANYVVDHEDYRYDICDSVIYSNKKYIQQRYNTKFAHKANISVLQQQHVTPQQVTSICRFQVNGFLDDIWSPFIYFKQWSDVNPL